MGILIAESGCICRMTREIVNTVSPILDAWLRSSPLGRVGRADEVRGVVTWLASDASSLSDSAVLSSTVDIAHSRYALSVRRLGNGRSRMMLSESQTM